MSEWDRRLDQIKPGDRVVMSPLGYLRLVRNFRRGKARSTIGVCVRVERMSIGVLRDGLKRPSSYAIDFWEKW